MEVLHKHWQTGKGAARASARSRSAPPCNCTKDGADTYEPLLAQIFSSDMLTALHDVVKILEGITRAHVRDASTRRRTRAPRRGRRSTASPSLANATRALVDPPYAKAAGLKDRAGEGHVAAQRRHDEPAGHAALPDAARR